MGIPGLWLTHFAFCLGENWWFHTALGKKVHFPPSTRWKSMEHEAKANPMLSQVFCRTHSSNFDISKNQLSQQYSCRWSILIRMETNTYTKHLHFSSSQQRLLQQLSDTFERVKNKQKPSFNQNTEYSWRQLRFFFPHQGFCALPGSTKTRGWTNSSK